jgi:hypothetical protein
MTLELQRRRELAFRFGDVLAYGKRRDTMTEKQIRAVQAVIDDLLSG